MLTASYLVHYCGLLIVYKIYNGNISPVNLYSICTYFLDASSCVCPITPRNLPPDYSFEVPLPLNACRLLCRGNRLGQKLCFVQIQREVNVQPASSLTVPWWMLWFFLCASVCGGLLFSASWWFFFFIETFYCPWSIAADFYKQASLFFTPQLKLCEEIWHVETAFSSPFTVKIVLCLWIF
jgi:hypothetical protein